MTPITFEPYEAPPPAVVLPNAFLGHMANWMAQQKYPTRNPLNVMFVDKPKENGARATTGRDGIKIGPSLQDGLRALASDYGKRGRLQPVKLDALAGFLHEMLHDRVNRNWDAYSADAENSPDTRMWEEGAAEQAVADLLPALTHQIFGHVYRPEQRQSVPYERESKAYRQLSVFGSGAGKYQDRAARLWRRQFVNAEPAQRQQMIAEANVARTAWGQRTGR